MATRSLASRLGERLSLLYRITGDPDHPFNEVVGVLQRVSEEPGGRVLHVCRRNGAVVTVPEADIVAMKFL